MAAQTEPRRWLVPFWSQGAKPFEGTVDGTAFRVLTRREPYSFFGFSRTRNAGRPVVVGRFEPAPGGCHVRGHMRLPLFILIFMPVFFTLWMGTFGAAVWNGAFGEDRLVILFPCAIIVFIYTMWTTTFWQMAGRAKVALTAALAR